MQKKIDPINHCTDLRKNYFRYGNVISSTIVWIVYTFVKLDFHVHTVCIPALIGIGNDMSNWSFEKRKPFSKSVYREAAENRKQGSDECVSFTTVDFWENWVMLRLFTVVKRFSRYANYDDMDDYKALNPMKV